MTVVRRAVTLARRLRHSERVAPVRRHLPALLTALAVPPAARGRRRVATGLLALATAGFARTYRRSRSQGRAATAEHVARMRRLRPDVLQTFYIKCIGSMEAELEEYPTYDRRKHEMRYRVVADTVIPHVREGGTVVDVGCASALVLDRVHAVRRTRGIGFDLSPNGIHQRHHRAAAPVLAQAVVEHIPLGDGVADAVVFSEVIEHLIDAYAGMREVGRVTRPGGILVLTTNNGSEMPVISPLRDPLTWVERLAGRWRPSLLAFRNITWHDPMNREVDPLPDDAPTYVPHFHFSFSELRDLAEDAGFELVSSTSFEFPAPQSPFADRLRRLAESHPRTGNLAADLLERAVAATPGLRYMGTHHLLVFRKVREPRAEARVPWWPAQLVDAVGSEAPQPAPAAKTTSSSSRAA